MSKTIDAVKAADQEITQTVKDIESITREAIENDKKLFKIINIAFSELSTRGQGLCLENLVREFSANVLKG